MTITWQRAPPPPPEETLAGDEPPPVPEEEEEEEQLPPLPDPPRHIKLGGKLGCVDPDDLDGLDLSFTHPFGLCGVRSLSRPLCVCVCGGGGGGGPRRGGGGGGEGGLWFGSIVGGRSY
eukprot:COSAG03_NODE_13273_length_509_cov_1.841463_2_plen_118_part_01